MRRLAHASAAFFATVSLVQAGVSHLINSRSLHGLYLGWLHFHNAGDDVLYDIASHLFSEVGMQFAPNAIAISLSPHLPPSPCQAYLGGIESYDFVVLGGGTLLRDNRYSCTLLAARAANKPIFVFGTGFDTPREAAPWVEVAALGAPAGGVELPAWGPWPLDRFDWSSTLGALLAGPLGGGVRGPISLVLANEVAGTHGRRTLKALGDAGILAKRVFESYGAMPRISEIANLADQARAAGRRMVAVNYGTNSPSDFSSPLFRNGMDSIYHSNTSRIAQSFQSLVCELGAGSDFDVLLFAMEPKDLGPMNALWESISAAQPGTACFAARMNGRLVFCQGVLSASATAMVLGSADLAVCYKLHGVVIAAAVGTPVLAVACEFDDLPLCFLLFYPASKICLVLAPR